MPEKQKGVISKSTYEHKELESIRDLLSSVTVGFWIAAEKIYGVRERGGYKALGYDTLEDYCEDGLGKSYSSIAQLLKAYEVAVLRFKYKPKELPDYTKVYLISEMMEKDPKNADEWLEKAKTLPAKALRKEKREAKTGVSEFDCKHESGKLMVVVICGKCRNWIKIHPKSIVYDDDGTATITAPGIRNLIQKTETKSETKGRTISKSKRKKSNGKRQ